MSDISSATSASTKTFLTALWFNAAVSGIEIVAFTLVRRHFRSIYEPRSYLLAEKCLPPLASKLLAWPLAVWRLDYRDILRQNGMDAFFFVRFLRMMVKMLLPIWLLSWIILMPITAVGSNTGKSGLDMFTFGGVGTNAQARYAAHLILTWLFAAWICYIVKKEMAKFVTMRQQFLVSPEYASTAQANTLLVTGVPGRFLSEQAIADLFTHLPGGVKKVWLNHDLKELPALYDQRLAACNKLESAETTLLKTATKTHAKQLKADMKAGAGARSSAEHGPPTIDALVPENKRPSHRLSVGPLPFALPLIGKKVDSIAWAREEIAKTSAKLAEGRRVLRSEVGREGRSHGKIGGVVGLIAHAKPGGSGNKSDSEMETYPPLNSAFVLFHNQIAVHLAEQVLVHNEPYRLSDKYVGVAPADVIWGNLGLNPYETKVRRVISYAATAALIIFWAIPVAFIGMISNVANLCDTYSWLAWICKLPNPVVGIIQGVLPPVLLAVLMMLLPIVLRMLAQFEGIPRRTGVELSIMTRYFLFQVIHSFLIVTLASGIIAALPDLVSNPTSVPKILASNLPQASTFFLTYIILQGLTGTASGFLQIVPLVIYYAKLYLLGSTPRSVYDIKYTLRSVEWGTLFPATTLLVVITLAYSVISPIINGLACFTFFLFFLLYKYLFLYQFEQPAAGDTGGLFFPKAIQHIFVGMYIQQICLAALFFLARDANSKASAIPEGALMVVLIICTAFFHMTINNSYGPLLHALPLSLAKKAHGPSAGPDSDATGSGPSATRHSSRSSFTKRKPVPSASTDRECSGSGSGEAKGDADVEKSEKARLAENEPEDFCHPASVEPQRIVWIPLDTLNLANAEKADCLEAGVEASTARAKMDDKGHVDIDGHPPGTTGYDI